MHEQATKKLWVIKFCIKVIFPKINLYQFLVFLAIKYRVRHKKLLSGKTMDTFILKTAPPYFMSQICKDYLEYNLDVLQHKCVIISREQYIQLSAENLFYLDHGAVWLVMKLSSSTKRKHEVKRQTPKENILSQFNLEFMTSEIHKKLFTGDERGSLENVRIVPVVGSKLVSENVAFFSENEYQNIALSCDLDISKEAEVTFHPIPSLDYIPKIAAVAEVSLIVNDYDLSNDFMKEVLSNHFEKPKLLSVNDIFSIELIPTVTEKYHFKYLDLVQSTGRLYFKCNKLLNSAESSNEAAKPKEEITQAFFIVKGVTQLTLGENIHMLKPKNEYFIPQEVNKQKINFLKLCPAGLKDKFDQIQETVGPFLSGEINELSSSMSSPIIPMLLLTGSVGSGRHLLVKTLAKYNGLNCLQVDCNALQSSTAKQTESKINSTVQKAKAAAPVMVLLDNFEVFAVDPENNEDCRVVEHFMNTITDLYQNYTKHQIIFVAVTERVYLKPNILRMFLEKFRIPKLNAQQRYEMLNWFASVMQLNLTDDEIEGTQNKLVTLEQEINPTTKDTLQRIAAKTETFMYGDLDTLVHFALRESYLKQLNGKDPSTPIEPDLHAIREEHFNTALDAIRSLQSQHLDAPKIPKVYWEDIGGLEHLKKELLKTIEFPIKYPHLFKDSALKRSGVLLYGPPGCGKTLVAKAVSTELNVSFLSVKGPELLNMYIGQSEENVRRVFESARMSSPCVVFLDELDALAGKRGVAGDSGGAADRLVSQLLAELDGVATMQDADTSSLVFVMGATNRPDLLEQSLLRPGRLDKLIYVGPYCGISEKTSVLRALCRSHRLCDDVDLTAVAAALPERVTGADLMAVVSEARATAVRQLVARLSAGLVKESELSVESVVISVSDIDQAVKVFRPSVTDEELAYYESIQSQM